MLEQPESAFANIRTDLAELGKRMKKFQNSKVTNLQDLEKRKAEEERLKANKDDMYIGKVFRVHRAQFDLFKLKKHLKKGTLGETYEKMIKPSLSESTLQKGTVPSGRSAYTFQKVGAGSMNEVEDDHLK